MPPGRSGVVVAPALSSVLGPSVEVRVTAVGDPGARLFLGRSRPDDAAALLRGTPSATVDGLDGARHLDVSAPPGRPGTQQPDVPDPASLDVWHQRDGGTGTASLGWRPTRGAESVVVLPAGDQAMPALDVEVTWTKGSWRLLAWGAVLPGLLLLGLALLLRRVLRPRRAAPARPAEPAEPSLQAVP
ncbi:hypothetical protein GCM10025868_39250 [Angustibacter aerolatus]|uniref:DUF3153 domain-containing protein n=1 Tax=Angustibacter aerolatus TaxID=1162965 RepID=A0ABQ6JPM9_9ACTN|nr:hypothetical protein GCM10025868_39250 [Angustibacter aerolatus]